VERRRTIARCVWRRAGRHSLSSKPAGSTSRSQARGLPPRRWRDRVRHARGDAVGQSLRPTSVSKLRAAGARAETFAVTRQLSEPTRLRRSDDVVLIDVRPHEGSRPPPLRRTRNVDALELPRACKAHAGRLAGRTLRYRCAAVEAYGSSTGVICGPDPSVG
jgi:hypothetical protein